MSRSFRSRAPDHWTQPRSYSDPSLRRHHHGPVQPMPLTRAETRRELLALLWIPPAFLTLFALAWVMTP